MQSTPVLCQPSSNGLPVPIVMNVVRKMRLTCASVPTPSGTGVGASAFYLSFGKGLNAGVGASIPLAAGQRVDEILNPGDSAWVSWNGTSGAQTISFKVSADDSIPSTDQSGNSLDSAGQPLTDAPVRGLRVPGRRGVDRPPLYSRDAELMTARVPEGAFHMGRPQRYPGVRNPGSLYPR